MPCDRRYLDIKQQRAACHAGCRHALRMVMSAHCLLILMNDFKFSNDNAVHVSYTCNNKQNADVS